MTVTYAEHHPQHDVLVFDAADGSRVQIERWDDGELGLIVTDRGDSAEVAIPRDTLLLFLLGGVDAVRRAEAVGSCV